MYITSTVMSVMYCYLYCCYLCVTIHPRGHNPTKLNMEDILVWRTVVVVLDVLVVLVVIRERIYFIVFVLFVLVLRICIDVIFCFNGVEVVIVCVRRWGIKYINLETVPNITCTSNIRPNDWLHYVCHFQRSTYITIFIIKKIIGCVITALWDLGVLDSKLKAHKGSIVSQIISAL